MQNTSLWLLGNDVLKMNLMGLSFYLLGNTTVNST